MKKLLFVLLAILPLCSFGIEPVIMSLDVNAEYTVPADKVLLIEHFNTTFNVRSLSFSVESEGSTNSLKYSIETPSGGYGYNLSLIRPVKAPSSARITNTSSSRLTILGVLVAPEDLYASIKTQNEGMLCQNGSFSFDVLAASPRPGKIKLQGSTDLVDWHPIVDATIDKIDPSSHLVSVPIAGNEKYYVKTLLTSVSQ